MMTPNGFDEEYAGLLKAAQDRTEARAICADEIRQLETLRDDLAGKLKVALAENAALRQAIGACKIALENTGNDLLVREALEQIEALKSEIVKSHDLPDNYFPLTLWCNAHGKRADWVFVKPDGSHELCCDPRRGHITISCRVVNLTGKVEIT